MSQAAEFEGIVSADNGEGYVSNDPIQCAYSLGPNCQRYQVEQLSFKSNIFIRFYFVKLEARACEAPVIDDRSMCADENFVREGGFAD